MKQFKKFGARISLLVIALSLMNVHYTWSRSIQSDTSRIQVLRGLYKCDSLNTLLSDNLNKATKKDSAQNVQILYLGKQLSEKEQ